MLWLFGCFTASLRLIRVIPLSYNIEQFLFGLKESHSSTNGENVKNKGDDTKVNINFRQFTWQDTPFTHWLIIFCKQFTIQNIRSYFSCKYCWQRPTVIKFTELIWTHYKTKNWVFIVKICDALCPPFLSIPCLIITYLASDQFVDIVYMLLLYLIYNLLIWVSKQIVLNCLWCFLNLAFLKT